MGAVEVVPIKAGGNWVGGVTTSCMNRGAVEVLPRKVGCNWVGGVITSCMKRGGDQSGSGSACWVRCTCGEYGEMYGVSCGGVAEVEGPAVAGAELGGTDVDGTDVSGAAAALCTP
ncbi:unnamed protein product [Camellia sinensis]